MNSSFFSWDTSSPELPEQSSCSLKHGSSKSAPANAPVPGSIPSQLSSFSHPSCLRHTELGSIQGRIQGDCQAYLGIRYAIADRWERAVLVEHWDGTYDATHFGDRACQFRGFYGVEDSAINQFYHDEARSQLPAVYSEDCLNLNIWTRSDAAELPVIVYIHGGAFLTGGNGEPFIDGEAFVQRGVILVSVNYRLGPFATAYGDGYTGNCAITDQIAALTWVHRYIADFGGDPNRVTIMGESAGAVSVQCLLLSPLARGLFQGAVMMSGGGDLSALGTPNRPQRAEPIWARIKHDLSLSAIQEMKSCPPYRLYAAWQKALEELPQFAAGSAKPVLDGKVLPTSVSQAQAQGTLSDVPCIFGILSADSWPFTLCRAALEYAARQQQAGRAPAYIYLFDRTPPGENPFGAFHGADLWYAFGTLGRCWRPFEEADRQISNYLLDYLSQFAKTGDPNACGLPRWEPSGSDGQVLRLADQTAMCRPDLEQLRHMQETASPYPYH